MNKKLLDSFSVLTCPDCGNKLDLRPGEEEKYELYCKICRHLWYKRYVKFRIKILRSIKNPGEEVLFRLDRLNQLKDYYNRRKPIK